MTSTPPTEVVLETELEPLSSEQLSIGDSELVSTSPLGKCSVSTVVKDVRHGYFVSSRDQNKRLKATIVVLQFNFGSQRRDASRSSKSIRHVKVKVSVDEVVDHNTASGIQDKGEDDLLDDYDYNDEDDLIIAAHYPQTARGASTAVSVTKEMTATLSPSANGFSVGSVAIGRGKSYSASSAITLDSYLDGNMCRVWELNEDTALKQGVPDALACAVLIRTSGRPFELRVDFVAEFLTPFFRMRRGGQLEVPIPARHLAERTNWARNQVRWDDFDSDDFSSWVKENTRNTWACTSEY